MTGVVDSEPSFKTIFSSQEKIQGMDVDFHDEMSAVLASSDVAVERHDANDAVEKLQQPGSPENSRQSARRGENRGKSRSNSSSVSARRRRHQSVPHHFPEHRCHKCNFSTRVISLLQHHIKTKHSGDAKNVSFCPTKNASAPTTVTKPDCEPRYTSPAELPIVTNSRHCAEVEETDEALPRPTG